MIIVNDGSTDKTPELLEKMQNEYDDKDRLNVIHLIKSVGKKQAIEAACNIAKGDIFLFIDSDCDIAEDAVEKTVQIFLSDQNIDAVTGPARVRGTDKGGILVKIQDVWFDG